MGDWFYGNIVPENNRTLADIILELLGVYGNKATMIVPTCIRLHWVIPNYTKHITVHSYSLVSVIYHW